MRKKIMSFAGKFKHFKGLLHLYSEMAKKGYIENTLEAMIRIERSKKQAMFFGKETLLEIH
jgi:hypothetical protein